MSTVHESVPSVPVRGSSTLNMASSTGVGSWPSKAFIFSQRQRTTCASADTTPGTRFTSPCGGKRMSKASSPTVCASTSSFVFSHARSLARMSMESVLATAPRPRGCSAPLVQTSKGNARPSSPSTWPTKSAKRP